ncbi:hypothetical protein FE257_005709 [Aspergillus nanangensis]|uniref:Uncharacterized protein n=1 Tax=Aspergillus nanangensis TaxID=2582783 RepID=A0AAD4GWJ6_ASPNN|nr:hypothetical protein FE257_005709 [Aspergillus nanangensis]
MASENWDLGLFECFKSDSCICATFTPCCLFGRIASRFKGKKVTSRNGDVRLIPD